MRSLSGGLRLLVGVAFLAIMMAEAAIAADNSKAINIDISAPDLAGALNQFAQQSDRQILFSSASTRGKHAPATHGSYLPLQALDRLLEGSGLRYRVNGETITVIGPGEAFDSAPEGGPGPNGANDGRDATRLAAAPPRSEGLETIVVTARRRFEAAQKTPVAITAYSVESLRAQQIATIGDLAHNVPGFTMLSGGNDVFDGLVSLRGIATLNVSQSLDPAVATYLDGVYQGFSGANLRDNYDVSQIQVLKGPQGTLFGRNSTGGAILIDHNLPRDDFEGWVRAGVGNHDEHEGAALLNVPIVPGKAVLRLVGGYYEHGGDGKSRVTGQELGDLHQWSGSATLRIAPADDLDIVLRGYAIHGNSNGIGGQPIDLVPGSLANQAVAGEMFGASFFAARAIAISPACGIVSPSPVCGAALAVFSSNLSESRIAYLSQRNTSNISDSPIDAHQDNFAFKQGGSLTITYTISDTLQLKSITGLLYAGRYHLQDFDGSGFNIARSDEDTAENQTTQEFQIIGNAFDQKLTYTLGLYYFFHTAKDDKLAFFFPTLAPAGPPFPFNNFFVNRARAESFAPYGQATYALTPRLNVTGGIRWTTESKEVLSQVNTRFLNTDTSFRSISYTGSIDYSPVDDLLLYVKTSRGFQSGGGQETAAIVKVFEPQIVTDYELGIKSEYFNHRLRINADVYHTAYHNLQQAVYVNEPGFGLQNVVVNAGAATTDGVEVELLGKPTRNLTLSAQGAYIYPKYLSFISADQDIKDTPFANVVRWSYTLSGEYVVPLKRGPLSFHLDWHWQSYIRFNPLPSQAPFGDGSSGQSPYGILNGRVSFHVMESNTELALWAKNITDAQYFTFEFDGAGTPAIAGLGQVFAFTGGMRRSFGFEVTHHF